MIRTLIVKLGYLFLLARRIQNRAIREYQTAQIAKHTIPMSQAGPGYITGLTALTVEENVHIGADFFIRAEGGVRIGENTHISHGLTIYSHNHDYRGKRLPYDDTYLHRSVDIGRNVWIGIHVTILPGTVVGDGAIIGAGATVNGQIEAGAIIGAATGQKIASRDMEHYTRLDKAKSYSGHGGGEL